MKKARYYILAVVFIAITFVSVSFAAFNTRLYINGSGMLRAQAEIRVNGIENHGYYGSAIENYNPNYDVDKTNASVDLPTSNSKVEYEVTIKNYGERAFMPEITLLSDVGENVVITISDGVHTYNLPDDDMEYEFAANEEKTFIY